ncbi:uncharacterized protein MONOS_17481 [Monocercomonoides exilis]|uniref:uncharacterized protein n=1 Tax=Monocercomonoides exilis TaxID=2049356 RepID=UPI00355A98D7|nr:hypothetical protein MONOS_17481 [Monocercomonoides exilis]
MFDIFNEEEIYNSDIKEILDEYTKKCESKRIAESENRTTLQKLASIAYESTNQRHIIILIKIIFLTLGDYGGWCFFESTLSNWIYEKEILEKFPFDENGHIKTEELCEALVMQTSRMAASFRILCAYVGYAPGFIL